MTRRRIISDAEGQSLIEIMMAAAIIGLALLATTQYAGFGYRQFQTQRQISTRNRLILQLTRLVGMPAALRRSYDPNNPAGPNPDLYNCVTGSGACDPKKIYDVEIYCPSFDKTTGQATCSPISGTRANPQYYDYLGYACADANRNCPVSRYPFQAYTQFQAMCPIRYSYYPNGGYNPNSTDIQRLYSPPTDCPGGQPTTLFVKLFLESRQGASYSLPTYTYVVPVPTLAISLGMYCLSLLDNTCL